MEDSDKALKARLHVGSERAATPGGVPRPERIVKERGETVTPKARPKKRPARRRKPLVKPPRAADRKLYAHERPPPEPLPERPDQSSSLDRDWRPADLPDMPTERTPTLAGFSLAGAILAIPISGIRFVVNLGMHAATTITRRVRRMIQQPLPD